METLPKDVRLIIYRYAYSDYKRELLDELVNVTRHIVKHFDSNDNYCCDPILWVTTSSFPYLYSMRQCRIIKETNPEWFRESTTWNIKFKITRTDIDWWRPHHTVEYKTPQALANVLSPDE